MTGPESIPLVPSGTVARRGRLALLIERVEGDDCQRCSLVEVTSVTLAGDVRAYRPVAYPTATPTRVSTTGRSVEALVNLSRFDREKAVEIARSHTWPGGQPFRPWADFAEAKEALRAARPAAAEPAGT